MLKPGQVFNNRYKIISTLGEGGFGAVYKVWDDNLQRFCAIKENLQVSIEFQKQFRREAIMLANLNHPHLVRVTDYFFIPDQGQYLVMDYVEGDNLETILTNNKGPLPSEQSLIWIRQVCDALIYIHNQNPPIIHRDIKPANIRITPQKNAVLVDFGLAKTFDIGAKTTMGARGLTPHFAAPEQYGTGGTDAQSDIYSLGVTLYCMLTYRVPPDSVEIMVGNAKPPPLAKTISGNIPDSISDALQCAMQIRRTERYKSVSDFKNALLGEQKLFAQVKVVESLEGQQKFEIHDLRLKVQMLSDIGHLTLVWAEGAEKSKGKSRFELYPADEFAIYTTPPSPEELWKALEIVKPRVVYVLAIPPVEEKAEDYLNRLAGFCKYAINQRDGKATVHALAAAMASRESAIQIGLEWLGAGGQLTVEFKENQIQLYAEHHEKNLYLQSELFIALKGILNETAAYRLAFTTTDDLKELFTYLPRQSDYEVPNPVQVITSSLIEIDKLDLQKNPTSNNKLTLSNGMEFMLVPAGKFLMGNNLDDGCWDRLDMPPHTVNIPYDYWMGRFPVTSDLYNAFVKAKGVEHPDYQWERRKDHPVSLVTWYNTIEYYKWLNTLLKAEIPSGLELRTPTEAEWEKAARGTDGREFPWGNTFDKNKCTTKEGEKVFTPVGYYSPYGDSPYGCADMSGNGWEWTCSLRKAYPFDIKNIVEKATMNDRLVLRGGSGHDWEIDARVFGRYADTPSPHDGKYSPYGFRVLLAPPSDLL